MWFFVIIALLKIWYTLQNQEVHIYFTLTYAAAIKSQNNLFFPTGTIKRKAPDNRPYLRGLFLGSQLLLIFNNLLIFDPINTSLQLHTKTKPVCHFQDPHQVTILHIN